MILLRYLDMLPNFWKCNDINLSFFHLITEQFKCMIMNDYSEITQKSDKDTK